MALHWFIERNKNLDVKVESPEFTIYSRQTEYEALYAEIDGLLFSDGSSKKGDQDKKDSSRKTTGRKDHVKAPTGQVVATKTKAPKSKRDMLFPEGQKPYCQYTMTNDQMVALISRTANFSKKQLEKLAKMAYIPEKQPNADL